jgi:hypothetical protein
MARKRLGQLLLERGLIDVDQLNSALQYHRQWGVRLGSAMVAKGFIAEGTLTRTLAESLQIPMVDLSKVEVDARALKLLKTSTCEQYEVFPIAVKEHRGRHTLLLAMADPLNVAAIDEVAFTTDMTVRPAIAQISSLDAAIRRHYHHQKIDIPALDFEKKREGLDLDRDEGEEMTILTAGAQERVISLKDEGPISLKEEEAISLEDADVIDHREVGDDPIKRAEEAMAMERAAAEASGAPEYNLPEEPDPFEGAPTGTFVMAPDGGLMSVPGETLDLTDEVMAEVKAAETDNFESLEKKFWALMRVLAKKNLISKEEFLEEFNLTET